MKPLADAVNGAEKLVFYAHCFSCAETGPADIPLDALDPQKPLVTGVADKPGKPDSKAVMQLPSGRPVPFGPAALERNLPDVQDGVERRGWHSYAPQIRRLRLQSPRSTKAGGIYRMVEHGCRWRARKRRQPHRDSQSKRRGRLCCANRLDLRSLWLSQPHENGRNKTRGARPP